jgi:hypothetical protein
MFDGIRAQIALLEAPMLRRTLVIAGLGMAAGIVPVSTKTGQLRLPDDANSQISMLLRQHRLVAAGDWRQRGRVVTLFADGKGGRYRVAVDLDQNAIIGLRASPVVALQAAR